MMKEWFRAWKEKNNMLPTSVLFYRDGVAEIQFKTCASKEVPQIGKA
jgi:hypothetical protein